VEKGEIQETLVSLYLRLNDFFVSGFIVHASHGVGTEMDVLAVRFPSHKEPEREVQPCRYLAVPTDHIDSLLSKFTENTARESPKLQHFHPLAPCVEGRLAIPKCGF
jgi:hypothetical protein